MDKLLYKCDIINYVGAWKYTLEMLRADLETHGIRMVYTDKLFTLSLMKEVGEQSRMLRSRCNGIIFSTETFKPLCVPPKNVMEFSGEKDLNGYKIKKVQDGTVVNLYWASNKWNIATTHSFDISKKHFMGPLTYAEIFVELLKKYKSFESCKVVDGSVSVDLDKNFSYTFILHWKDFHPVGEDGVWQIHTYNLKTLDKFEIFFPDIPILEEVESINVPSEYGFILRWNGVERDDIIIRSPLMDFIKHTFYTIPADINRRLDHTNRFKYLMMRAYLSPDIRDKVKNLIDVAKLFDEFNSLITGVIYSMICLARKEPDNTEYKTKAKIVLDRLDINAFVYRIGNRDVKSIIEDYIQNPSFAYLYTILQ